MNYLNDIIKGDEFFIEMPDCIADGGSYKESIEKALILVKGNYDLENYKWEKDGNKYKLTFMTKAKQVEFEVSIMSDYIDGKNLCIGLDKVLSETGYIGDKRFVSISGETVDFAVAFITDAKDKELKDKGLNYN
jgi:hypothetical protein